MTVASTPFTYTLTANEEVVIKRRGSKVRCTSAGDEFSIQGLRNNGEPDDVTTINEGIAHTLDPFDKLRVINGSTTQTLTIYVGEATVDDSRQYGNVSSVIASVAGVSDTTDVTVSSGTNEQIVAANANRKQLTIVNTSTTNTLRVGSSNANATRGVPIAAGQSLTLDYFDGALYGYAIGANIDVAILEITS